MFENDVIYVDLYNKKIPIYTRNLYIKQKQKGATLPKITRRYENGRGWRGLLVKNVVDFFLHVTP